MFLSFIPAVAYTFIFLKLWLRKALKKKDDRCLICPRSCFVMFGISISFLFVSREFVLKDSSTPPHSPHG